MDKKTLKRSEFEFLNSELDYLEQRKVIDSQLKERVKAEYQPKEKIPFLRFMLAMGAILVGLGIISFLAGNWKYINNYGKLGIIIATVLITNLTALSFETKFPKTSRALYYLGVIELGAGIILINNIFSIRGETPNLFLLWGLGILPVVLSTRDKLIGIFFAIMSITYMESYYTAFSYNEVNRYPYIGILLVAIGYFVVRELKWSKPVIFFANGELLTLIGITVHYIMKDIEWDYIVVTGVMFLIGLFMANYKFKGDYRKLVNFQGHLVHGVAGISLSSSEMWHLFEHELLISSAFAILYFLYLMYLIKKENLISIIFSGIIVLTLYSNLARQYVSQSTIFIVGGLILIGFGYYFEKKRRAVSHDDLGK